MSENNNPNPNTLDLETYSYLKTEYGTAQKELREKNNSQVLQGEIDREANKATQLNNALHQPKHIPSSYTNKVVKETIDQQKQADQRISEAQQKELMKSLQSKMPNSSQSCLWTLEVALKRPQIL
ncbi:MAG: hypothetical protein IPF93_13180 [Saprospiraceae bacterium]|nr:hypothetical protein [Saprospiraceae bacterium]